ncbi:hypothetical protein JTB14_026693 [Gonioctena quinquepunctata]|nr:hypothetical protein JTB14_026693 [Gonioctena quinquepunctata]
MKYKRYRSSSSSSSSSSEDFDILKRENYHLRKKLKRLKRRRKHVNNPGRFSETDGSVSSDSRINSPDREFGEKHTAEGEDPLEIEFVDVSLNENIINALGGQLEEKSLKQGEEIHHDLAKRWDAILKKGLDDPSKEAILKKYPTPSNCISISPPKLNAEIKVAAKDTAVTRDTTLELVQSQTGAALTAIGKCLTKLLKSEDETVEGRNNLDLIEGLSDSARLIADLHYKQSTARQNLVSMNLDQSLKDMIEDTSLDGFLFGDNLTERLKTNKAIERAGVELRKTAKAEKQVYNKNTRHLNSKKPFRRNFHLGGKNQGQSGRRATNYYQSHHSKLRSSPRKDKNYRSRRRI